MTVAFKFADGRSVRRGSRDKKKTPQLTCVSAARYLKNDYNRFPRAMKRDRVLNSVTEGDEFRKKKKLLPAGGEGKILSGRSVDSFVQEGPTVRKIRRSSLIAPVTTTVETADAHSCDAGAAQAIR